jgi:hypothetical protein
MLQRTLGSDTHLSAIAEQQMRKWTIGLEVQERLNEHGKSAAGLPQHIRPYVRSHFPRNWGGRRGRCSAASPDIWLGYPWPGVARLHRGAVRRIAQHARRR